MSALTRGPETVLVTPYVVTGQDRTGSNVYGPGLPIEYTGCMIEPASLTSFTQAETPGYINADYILIRAEKPAWVGGPKAIIRWRGRDYDQVGELRRYGRGNRTRHIEVKLKARGGVVEHG